jgi:HEAT repeat protein
MSFVTLRESSRFVYLLALTNLEWWMDSILRSFSELINTALLVTVILAGVSAGIALLILFLMALRAWQYFRTRRFDAVSFKLHGQWRAIVRGEVPAKEWRMDSLRCEILQSIVIQEIDAATDKDRAGLQKFLRSSGLLDRCIERAHGGRGWKRRRAMQALGGMRVPEAILPLSEALDDWQLDTRIAAVQALGRTGLAQAAEPILETHMVGALKVPEGPVANALVRCYMDQPEAILPYLRRSQGESRELLALVASELATPRMADEMILLAEDPRPEVRACAARALAAAPLPVAIPALAKLARDETWFVRLRAVSSLHQFLHPRAIPALLDAVRDSNRLVRIRAATALAKFEHETLEILQSIVDSRDRYALHAMISALELGGGFEKVKAQLADPLLQGQTASHLLDALREGAAGIWTTRPADPVVESVFP